MERLQHFIDSELTKGRAYFSKADAQVRLSLSPEALQKAVMRLTRKGLIASPRRGFFLVLRAEDRLLGAPDPGRWIDPLMKHLGVDYRVSLLRAAAFHGSSHQAAMVFQVIAPRQLPKIQIGRQRIEFLFQSPTLFAKTNRPDWLGHMKTEAGYAKIAGIELTLLDTCRYFHRAAGISGAAQAIYDLGRKAEPRILAKAASAYENSAVRRLGYLLERFGHVRQAESLRRFAKRAKSFKALDPSSKPIVAELAAIEETNSVWKLIINVPVEIDT